MSSRGKRTGEGINPLIENGFTAAVSEDHHEQAGLIMVEKLMENLVEQEAEMTSELRTLKSE